MLRVPRVSNIAYSDRWNPSVGPCSHIGLAQVSADSTSVLSTLLRSKVERLMTLRTSAVAVCCCRDSRRLVSAACSDGD